MKTGEPTTLDLRQSDTEEKSHFYYAKNVPDYTVEVESGSAARLVSI